MNRQRRTTAILLAVFLVLAAVVYLVEFYEPAEEDEPSANPLWDITDAQIVHLVVHRAGGEPYQLERDEMGVWYIVSPFHSEANQAQMSRLVRTLVELKSLRQFAPDEVDLKAFGLITPTATISVVLHGGDEYILEVGGKVPRRLRYYVRLGEEVHLAPQEALDYILEIPLHPPAKTMPPEMWPTETAAPSTPSPSPSATP